MFRLYLILLLTVPFLVLFFDVILYKNNFLPEHFIENSIQVMKINVQKHMEHQPKSILVSKNTLQNVSRSEQTRLKACTFYDPLYNRFVPILCGIQDFPSIVKSKCKTRLGNQMSAYAAVRYFQQKYGMIPLMDPFQMKILNTVFRADTLKVHSLNLKVCCKDSKSWNTLSALKEDKRTGIATGLTEDFTKNFRKYSRNFVVGLGPHTVPLFLFKEILPTLRKEFLFKQRFTFLSQKMLQEVKQRESAKNLIFVEEGDIESVDHFGFFRGLKLSILAI